MLKLKKSIFLDTLRQPFKTAIVTAAKLGADAVEINGRTEIKPEDISRTGVRHIRKLLSDQQLSVSAIHFQTNYGYGDLQLLDQRIDGTKAEPLVISVTSVKKPVHGWPLGPVQMMVRR